MKNNLLQIKNLSFEINGLKILHKVGISIKENEIVAILGPNGAGKSSVLKCLFGLVPTANYHLFLKDKEVKFSSDQLANSGIAYVMQGQNTFENLTVLENLYIGCFGISDKKAKDERIEEILNLFPIIKAKLNQKTKDLSGGQKQIVAIMRAIISRPCLLILDEPTIGLSPKVVKEVFALIKHIKEKYQIAFLIVEHNLKSLMPITDKVYVIRQGEIVFEGSPVELEGRNILHKVYLGKL